MGSLLTMGLSGGHSGAGQGGINPHTPALVGLGIYSAILWDKHLQQNPVPAISLNSIPRAKQLRPIVTSAVVGVFAPVRISLLSADLVVVGSSRMVGIFGGKPSIQKICQILHNVKKSL